MKIAADVVVLVEWAENSLGVRAAQSKIGEWGEESKAARDGQIFFDDLRRVMDSDPQVRAGISIRHVDVKQIRLVDFAQSLAQFCGAMFRAIQSAGSFLDSVGLIEAGNFAPGDPQPRGRRRRNRCTGR